MFKASTKEKGTFLRDSIFAANDGIITTFAVVAGSAGASLDASIVLILGFANLLADGFSMASGNYLGVKSEIAYRKAQDGNFKTKDSPSIHGVITFFSFIFAGILPLIPYLFGWGASFKTSSIVVGISLFTIGTLRSFYTKKSWLKSGLEMFLIGGFAAIVAYGVGRFVEMYVI